MIVNQIPRVLNRMLGRTTPKPRTLFSDRGPGFYHKTHGTITTNYDHACRTHGFKPWAGTHAKKGPHAQPPDIADVLLHETAVSWVKARLIITRKALKRPWEETPEEFAARLQCAVKYVNENYEVQRLCEQFPARLAALRSVGGDRLPK